MLVVGAFREGETDSDEGSEAQLAEEREASECAGEETKRELEGVGHSVGDEHEAAGSEASGNVKLNS